MMIKRDRGYNVHKKVPEENEAVNGSFATILLEYLHRYL
jgi:hypothetical protein